jgi:hypothetical protein
MTEGSPSDNRSFSPFLVCLLLLKLGLSEGAGAGALYTNSQHSSYPLSPSQAIASFRVEPGFRVELAASEPTTIDPVAIAFDEKGRMFVVEDRGYPTGPPAGHL